jgi:hypothetical protein
VRSTAIPERAGLLVRGGSVVERSGRPAYDADVRVRDVTIAEISPALLPGAEPQLERAGRSRPDSSRTHMYLDLYQATAA